MENERNQNAEAAVTPEIYFLITKFLANGPLKDTAKVLVRELEEKKVLPQRTDWEGNKHDLTFKELEQKYAHIEADHLLQICMRIGPMLDKELSPSVPGLLSLLGRGRQSLLRTQDTIYRSRSLLDYCTRWHGASLPDSALTKPVHNLQNVLIGREYGGPVRHKMLVPTTIYAKTKLLRRTVGHLSSVYCVLFDRTGRYIITGADDLLIKIWSALDGRLLATLRGASAEITDIAINLDNTMLAAGSLDRVLRVWDLQTTCPIAVLTGHTGMITSVNFCPSPRSDMKYLVTTSTDGSIAFWQYSMPRGQKITFMPKPIQYHEKLRPGQAQMMCTTFSAGGMFLAAGSADHHVRVYLMAEDGPKRILETEVYTDAVDSVQWAHRGLRFISGSKDGSAHIWTFESQQWKNIKLSMTDRLPSCPTPEGDKKYKVTMVAWDCSDKYVITAVNDFTIKIWNSKSGKLHSVLRGHKDELYVLESNPKDEHVLLSAGHDGQVFLWDIERGTSVAHFINDIDGQGHGGVFDAKWSPDGTMIAATDSHGHILIFGLGYNPDKYKILPTELFFHTDYRPLLRDASHHVVDEQTQIMPHLMPPPFLVDADGNPHPARFQRYVPGRENCTTDQLVPNFVVAGDGIVIDDNSVQQHGVPPAVNANGNFSQIDRLIAALANRQSYAAPGGNNIGSHNQSQLDRMIEVLANRQGQDHAPDSFNRSNSVSRRSIAGLENGRNSREPERRPESVWGRPVAPAGSQQEAANFMETLKFVRCTYVRPMKYCQLQNLRQAVFASGQFEMQEYKREMRRRPIMINTASSLPAMSGGGRQRNNRAGQAGNAARTSRRRGQRQQPTQAPAYRTRAVRDQEVEVAAQREDEEEDEDESSGSSGDTSYSNVEEELESSEDSDTESSDYSDWVADTPGPNLEPPKRAKRKPLSRTRNMSDDSSDEHAEQATTSANASGSAAPKRNKNLVPKTALNGEIPEIYRPAEWLSEVIPRKAPYYPQMGDEVVYFRQGHQRYLEAVRSKKVYKLSQSAEPWNFRTLRNHEFVRVIGIKYEIRPPRLCCLKLAMMDEEGNMTGSSFKIKYHDMPDVLDFLVLRQTYDLAVQRNWTIGDRFRCMIGDGWWMGQIESRHPLSNEFPDSYFMCFHVRWDNGEYEYMSPWDMEPIDENRLPDEVGGAVPVLPEEIRATLYQPKSEEWHRGDRDGSCRRIIAGLEQVMRLSIAEHFLAPVDLNIYPDYAFLIEYPIDLTTIKSRFENHFYRRITSAQFDVRYLATNAEKYNRSHTNIVKHARIITDLCLRVIRDPNDMDVAAVYHQLVDVYHSSETENDNESDAVPSTSTGPSTSVVARQKAAATRRSNRIRSDGDWRLDCRQLLDLLIRHPDSAPFREPVDTIEFPDYLEIIPTPMDLRTVKEDLLGGNYDDPLDFAKDVRLIFQNSRNYNTNARSRIYSMTLRLSSLFEKQIKTVLSNWKAARRRANKGKSPRGRSSGKPKTRRNAKSARQLLDSDDDDDDDDDVGRANNFARGGAAAKSRSAQRNGLVSRTNEASTSSSNNRVTSSSSHRLAALNGESQTRNLRRQATQLRKRKRNSSDDDEQQQLAIETERNLTAEHSHTATTSDDDDEDELEKVARAPDEDDDVEDDDDDDDDEHNSTDVHTSGHNTNASEHSSITKTRLRERRPTGRRHAGKIGSDDTPDSEDSYKPAGPRRSRKPNSRKRRRPKGGRRAKISAHYVAADARLSAELAPNRQRQRRRPRYGASSLSDAAENDKSAHLDETTQETPTNTPKKKGRPPKNRRVTSAEHTASSNDPGKPSPTRLTRNNAYNPRRNAAVTDHSYHLPTRNLRHVDSDTDSREHNARFTRRNARQQPTHNWTEGSAGEETEEGEEILPTPTPTKVKLHESEVDLDDRPSTSRAALAAMRKPRLPPKLTVALGEDDSDDSSDNVPLANTQSSETSANGRRHLGRLPVVPNGPLTTAAATRFATNVLTRSHATSTTTNAGVITTTAGASSRTAALPPIHDHNYLGSAAAPRGREAQRFTRLGLSRHQRDASELDTSIDPLENSLLLSATSRLHAASSSTTTTAAAEETVQQEVRRGRSRYSQQSETDGRNGEVDADTDEPFAEDSVEHDSDSEDDQPLTSYVAKDRRAGRAPRRSAKAKKYERSNRRNGAAGAERVSDEDYELSYEPSGHANARKRRHHESNASGYGATNGGRNHRGTRNLKRPRYNEETDEDDNDARTAATMAVDASSSGTMPVMPGNGARVSAVSRLRGKLPTNVSPHKHFKDAHGEDDDDDDVVTTTDSDEQLVSVSSRGRVRKITARARRIFKD